MAAVPNMSDPCGRGRWLRAVMAAVAVMALAACTGSAEGTITDNPTPTPSESLTADLTFAPEIPDDICPTAEIIPDDFAAPEDIGYTAEFEPGTYGEFPYQECTYVLNEGVAALDGIQAVEKVALDFYVTDGSPFEPLSTGVFSPVDFEEIEAAEYFHDWDQVEDASEIDFDLRGKGLESSYLTTFQFYAMLDNLYVYAYISFVAPDEDLYTERELDTDEAAYRILESIVAPVVAELERQ